MLNHIQQGVRQHVQTATTSFAWLIQKPLASIITILVLAITLVLPLLFWVLSDNVHQLTAQWRQGERISLYLKPTVSLKEQNEFLLQVQALHGVGSAKLQTPAEGLVFLQRQEGMQDIMRYLPENPLPPVIEIFPTLDLGTPKKLEALTIQLKAFPQVELVKLDVQWVKRLNAILHFISITAQGFMLLLALAVVLIISNTLRLAVQNRYEEIQVLKLIGASNAFIMRPFLYSGIWYGFLSALLAVLLVQLFLLPLSSAMHKVAAAYQTAFGLQGLSVEHMLFLFGFAIVLGWLAAALSVRKQLAYIEP